MGWSAGKRVLSCATIYEKGGVTKGDGAGAGSAGRRDTTLAPQHVLPGCPEVLQVPDLTSSITTPWPKQHRSTCSPDAREAHAIHSVTLNSL